MVNTQRVQASWQKMRCRVFSVVTWWPSEIFGQTPLDFPLQTPFLIKDGLVPGTSRVPPDLGAVPRVPSPQQMPSLPRQFCFLSRKFEAFHLKCKTWLSS